MLRKTLEAMYGSYTGDKTTDDWKKFETYCGRFWFSNGNHHHYSNDKFFPECSSDYFIKVAKASDSTLFPKNSGESMDAFLARIKPIIYDPKIAAKKVNLDPSKIRQERVELGLCPRCGVQTGSIIRENSRAFGCTSHAPNSTSPCQCVICYTKKYLWG